MDGAKFLKLVHRAEAPLLSFLMRLGHNREEAQEILQGAVLRAWEARERFRGRSQFKTWLFKIALNLSRDHRRQQGRFEELASEPPSEQDPLGELIAREEKGRLIDAMEKLPDKQKMALLLKVFGEMKYREVAEVMGCSVGAAKAHFHHALYKLKEALREDEV